MDGVIESGWLTTLGPGGLAFVALVVCYFIYQRQTDQFSQLSKQLDENMDGIKNQISETNELAKEALSKVDTVESANRAAFDASTKHVAAFQLEVARSSPSREEMHNAIDRMSDAFKEALNPMRDDLRTIKEAILRKVV